MPETSNRKSAKLLSWLKNARAYLLIILTIVILRSVIADQYHVPTGSMIPTIHVGDRIFVNKMAYRLRIPLTSITLLELNKPKRGDIVVFEHPKKNITMVKRLIAIPGDRVEINNGFVSVNGKELLKNSRPLQVNLPLAFYTEKTSTQSYKIQRIVNHIKPEHQHFAVPKESYFFMGDNRDNSNDSRAWGFVPRKLIRGKAIFVLYSMNDFNPDWQRFGNSLYQ